MRPRAAVGLRKSPTLASMADADMGTFSISSSDSHQFTASTPSSPESRRAASTRQEPAAPAGTPGRSGSGSADNSPEAPVKQQAKLQKPSHGPRRRSSSPQTASLSSRIRS